MKLSTTMRVPEEPLIKERHLFRHRNLLDNETLHDESTGSKEGTTATPGVTDSLPAITKTLLESALNGVGDGSGLIFSSRQDYYPDNFVNISSSSPSSFNYNIDDGSNYDGDNGTKRTTRPVFSSEFASGYFEFPSSGSKSENSSNKKTASRVRTKVSYVMSACICRDVRCQRTAAIDIFGVLQADNGEYRGYSPILFVDQNGQDIPCLDRPPSGTSTTSSSSTAIPMENVNDNKDMDSGNGDHDGIVYLGCDRKTETYNNTVYHHFRKVVNCKEGEIENLRLLESSNNDTSDGTRGGVVFGRTLSNNEVVPQLSGFNPEGTFEDLIKSLKIGPTEIHFEPVLHFDLGSFGAFDIPFPFSGDIAPPLNTVLQVSAISAMDTLGMMLRGGGGDEGEGEGDFDSSNHPASQAKLHEIVRLSDSFSMNRLVNSINRPTEMDIRQMALYRDIVSAQPESSPVQEVISGIGLLMVATSMLGASIGTLWRQKKQQRKMLKYIAPIMGSLTIVILELSAFSLRWIREKEENNYRQGMAAVEVAVGDRFDGILPLGAGKDGNVMIVTTIIAEVFDNSSDLTGLFIFGIFLAILSFVVSLLVGKRWDLA